jgi:hypothetical protein
MKKLALLTFFLAFAATAAHATPSTPPKTGAASAQSGQKLDEEKSKILGRISSHISELQQRQSCVQSATTRDALKACMPEKSGNGGCGK